MLKGFREFLLRGNVIDLAVAVVIGAAFTAIVNSIVNSVINPLIGALFSADTLSEALPVYVPKLMGGDPAVLYFGAVIAAVINFVLVAAVVYFALVTPINYLTKKAFKKQQEASEAEKATTPPSEVELLTEIRDLLSRTDAAGPGKHADPASAGAYPAAAGALANESSPETRKPA